jgi:hypothetical protein
VKEVSIFLMGMGVLFGVLGYTSFDFIPPQAPSIWGVARRIFFGVSLLGLGALQLLSGILFISTKKSLFAFLGASAAAFLAIMSIAFSGITLLNILLASGPLLIAKRLSQIRKSRSERAEIGPDPPGNS